MLYSPSLQHLRYLKQNITPAEVKTFALPVSKSSDIIEAVI